MYGFRLHGLMGLSVAIPSGLVKALILMAFSFKL